MTEEELKANTCHAQADRRAVPPHRGSSAVMNKDELRANVEKRVAALPPLTEEQCRRIAEVLGAPDSPWQSSMQDRSPVQPQASSSTSAAQSAEATREGTKPSDKSAVMLSRQEVADRLGVSKHWLIRNAEQGPTYYKLPGGTIRCSEADLASWLRQRRVSD